MSPLPDSFWAEDEFVPDPKWPRPFMECENEVGSGWMDNDMSDRTMIEIRAIKRMVDMGIMTPDDLEAFKKRKENDHASA